MRFFNFLSGASPEVPQKAHLDRVHLIVHPGDGLSDKNLEAETTLLQAITTRAIALEKRKELAVVLLQMSEEEMQSIRDPLYRGQERILATALREIEAGIPDNVIVVPNTPSVAHSCLERAFLHIREQIVERDFFLDEKTELLAYGETVTKCVPHGAMYFAKHFGLKQPPIIDVNCTDALISDSPARWRRNGICLSFEQTLNGNRLRYIPIGGYQI